MVTREDIIGYISSLPSANHDFPFEGNFDSFVLRHSDTKKWFGLVMRIPEKYFAGSGDGLNLKCPEDLACFLQAQYKGVIPAYHMNKKQWITVMLDSDVLAEEIFKLIELSYDLTGGAK